MADGDIGSDTGPTLLQAGQVIRPWMTTDKVYMLVRQLYGLEVETCRELPSYDDRNYHVTVKTRTNNLNIDSVDSNGYVLKVLNSMDSAKNLYIDAMNSFFHHLAANEIPAPQPVPNIHNKLMSLETLPKQDDCNGNSGATPDYSENIIRLFTFVPGTILHKVPYTATTLYNVGVFCGKQLRVLQSFHHTFYDTHTTIWSLANTPKLSEFLYAVTDEKDAKVVHEVIHAFNTEVLPMEDKLQKGIIHGDFNEQNVLVKEIPGQEETTPKDHDVCGIIDIGDATYTNIIYEVAIGICYTMIESAIVDPLDVGGYILAGVTANMPVNETEMELLQVLVASRLCQTLVMGAYTYMMDPGNEYVLTTAARGWPCLHKLWACPRDELYARWNRIVAQFNN